MKHFNRLLLITAIVFIAGISNVRAEMNTIYTSDGNGNVNINTEYTNNGTTLNTSVNGYNYPTTPAY